VHLPIFELGQAIVVIALQQDADKRMQEVHMLGGRLERERIDRVVAAAQADFEVAPSKQRRQLAVAVAKIQDDGERVVLLRMRGQEVDEKAFATTRRAQDERVPDVFDMEIKGVGRVVGRFEYGERLSTKVTAGALARVEGKEEAQIRGVRLKDG